MKIYGLRIYPQSVSVVQGVCAPIFVHGSVSDGYSDFFYIFRPMVPLWKGLIFANDITINRNDDGSIEDPMPRLRAHFGSALVDGNAENGLIQLNGDGFESWGRTLHFCEGAFLPVFRKAPNFTLLKRLYWSRNFRLSSDNWPTQMRAILHMWDDIYWQLFSTERSDIDLLINAHSGDPRLKLFFVDFDREFPDPSNEELQPAAHSI